MENIDIHKIAYNDTIMHINKIEECKNIIIKTFKKSQVDIQFIDKIEDGLTQLYTRLGRYAILIDKDK